MTSYDFQYFSQNLLDIYYEGCLQNTIPQNINIWPNDGHFMTMTIFSAEIFKNFKSRKTQTQRAVGNRVKTQVNYFHNNHNGHQKVPGM